MLVGKYADGGITINRTAIFTGSAAHTLIRLNNRPLLFIGSDGQDRTLFAANIAQFVRIPGNTPRMVDNSLAHLNFFQRDLGNRAGRAYFLAGQA